MSEAEWLLLLCYWAVSFAVLILFAYGVTRCISSCTGRCHSMIWSAVLFTGLLLPITPFLVPPVFDLTTQTSYTPIHHTLLWMALSCWVTGVIFLFVKHTALWLRITSLCHQTDDVESERINKLVEHIRLLLFLNQSVPVKTADWITVPFIKGLWKPVLYVPPFLLTGTTNQTRQAVIAHELAYINRYDLPHYYPKNSD